MKVPAYKQSTKEAKVKGITRRADPMGWLIEAKERSYTSTLYAKEHFQLHAPNKNAGCNYGRCLRLRLE